MEKKLTEFRKSLRLIDFGYKGSAYIYFITLCTMDRHPLFSNTKIAKVIEDEMEYRRAKKEVKKHIPIAEWWIPCQSKEWLGRGPSPTTDTVTDTKKVLI